MANSRPQGSKYSQILERWEQNRGRNIYPEQFEANPLTESFYWLLLAENGMLGLATFLMFALITLWHGMRTSVAFWKTPLGLMLFGVTVAFAITYFHGQVERVLTQTKNLTTWIMLCAVLSKAEWWRRMEDIHSRCDGDRCSARYRRSERVFRNSLAGSARCG